MSQYRDLDVAKNEIRLVRLLPSSKKASPIKCELFYTSLDRPASERFYEALSYTWGGSAAAHKILLNGHQFDVTDNLHAALLELRLEKQDRYLWIDAICINQFDVLERNREVLRMLGIYQNAQQVVVWLGTDILHTGSAVHHLMHLERKWREQSRSTFMKRSLHYLISMFEDATLFLGAAIETIWRSQHIRTLLSRFAIHSIIHWYTGSRLWSGIFFLLILYQNLLPAIADFVLQTLQNINEVSSARLLANAPEPAVLNALKHIFESEWFTRVWIIQEIAAASHAVVQCGSYQISWKILQLACKQLGHETSHSWTRHPYADTGFQRAFNLVSTLATEDISTELVREKRALLSLLSEFNVSNATLPHDKVYGLLGLASDVRQKSTSVAALEAHYERDVEVVYTEVARWMIESSCNLRILHACLGKGDLILPSWVPDWSYAAWRLNEGTTDCFRLPGQPETTPVATFSDCGQRIHVVGFVIGTLQDVIETLNSDERREFRLANRIIGQFVIAIMTLLNNPLSWTILRCFLHLICRIHPEVGAEFSSYFDFYRRFAEKSKRETETPTPTFQEDESAVLLQQERFTQKFETTPILDFKYMKWPCSTWATGARVGDVLCLLVGADRPMILRRKGNDWELVGPAGYGGTEMFIWERAVKLYLELELQLSSFTLV